MTTHFNTLEAAFKHKTTCPFCDHTIAPGYIQMSYNGSETLVRLRLGNGTLTVDYNTGSLKSFEVPSGNYNIPTTNYPVYASNGSACYNTKSGKELFKVICHCYECSCYVYVLQVHIDWTAQKIIDIVLNSERFSLERGPVLHEIKNIYTTEKTEYTTFTNYESEDDKPNDKQTTTLPLIPMDLENPDKTLNRIKTLVVFS